MWPSLPFTASAKALVKFPFTLSQVSSIGVARPWSAKKRIRCPENQVKASSGVPWRGPPVGELSDALLPTVTVPPATEPVPPPLVPPPAEHAASTSGTAARLTAPARPFSTVRRLTRCAGKPAHDGGRVVDPAMDVLLLLSFAHLLVTPNRKRQAQG